MRIGPYTKVYIYKKKKHQRIQISTDDEHNASVVSALHAFCAKIWIFVLIKCLQFTNTLNHMHNLQLASCLHNIFLKHSHVCSVRHTIYPHLSSFVYVLAIFTFTYITLLYQHYFFFLHLYYFPLCIKCFVCLLICLFN